MNNNIKYRIKFTKLDRLRFIGHLDLLSLFQRCIKRTGLPIAYSQGFNPHQIMSFALPLSLGMGSIGEYLDIELTQETKKEEIVNSLNEVLPQGLEILDARKLKQGEKNAASIVEAGIYDIALPINTPITQAEINEMLAKAEINLTKETKKKTTIVDIRKNIYKASLVINEDNKKVLNLLISAGSKENLKPEMVINYLYTEANKAYDPYKIYYLRKDLLKRENNNFISIMETSE